MVREFLHKHVWRALPRSFRRELLFTSTRLLAPQISAQARAAEPIVVVGAFRTATGLGQSARMCYEALRASKLRTYGVDISPILKQPIDLPNYPFDDGRHAKGAGTLLLHVNAPFIPLILWKLGKDYVREKHIVGYWHWELPRVPDDWRYGLPFVHQALAPSRFTASAIQKVHPALPVSVLAHPVAVSQPRRMKRGPASKALTVLIVLNVASGFTRKNPLAGVEAFRRAFGGRADTKLIVKASHLDAYPIGSDQLSRAIQSLPNALLIADAFSPSQMEDLFRQSDIVLSLHRSEGFGLVLAEGMLSGCVPVATDWSGTADFVSSSTGMPVKFDLVPAADPEGLYHNPDLTWAEPDINDATAKMVRLAEPDIRASLSHAAQEHAETRFSASAYLTKLRQILDV